jgi:CHASE2 domain-containing sensor protein
VTFLKKSGQRISKLIDFGSGWTLRRFSALALLSTIAGGLGLLLLIYGNPLQYLDNRWLDLLLEWRYRTGLAPPADPHIVHLDVGPEDLRSLSSLGAEYQNIAEIIREATVIGVKTIALDIIFERGSSGDAKPIQEAINFASANNTVVIMAEALFSGSSPRRGRSFPFAARQLPAGLINVEPDADGIFRRYRLLHNGPSEVEPSFALATYLAWRGVDWEKDVKFPKPGLVNWPELGGDYSSVQWCTADLHPVLENFGSSWQGAVPAAFRHYSLAELHKLYEATKQPTVENVAQATNSKPLAGCVVIVSYVGSGIGDLANTPLGNDQPRAILHTVALNDLIQHRFLQELPGPISALSVVLLVPLGLILQFWRENGGLIRFWFVATIGCLLMSFAAVCFTRLTIPAVEIVAICSIAVGGELLRRHLLPTFLGIAPVGARTDASLAPRVFITSKSEDYPQAGRVYRFLTSRGIPTFLSSESLPGLGRSDYRKEIDRALDSCQHMIVVTSSVANASSAWVEAEWGIFVNEQRSGRKKGNLITVTTKTLETAKLPPALRSNEIILLKENALETIAGYVS